jgi:hypothetical protein
LFAAIRELAHREELSIRSLAERFAVHRRTVRQALITPEPPPRKKQTHPASRLDPTKELIDAILITDPTAPAGHIWERLLDEYATTGSYSTVRGYVARQRPRPTHRRDPETKVDDEMGAPRARLEHLRREPLPPIPAQVRAGRRQLHNDRRSR